MKMKADVRKENKRTKGRCRQHDQKINKYNLTHIKCGNIVVLCGHTEPVSQ